MRIEKNMEKKEVNLQRDEKVSAVCQLFCLQQYFSFFSYFCGLLKN